MDSQDDEGSFVLLPAKRKRRTNFDKCVICQIDTDESLRTPLPSSIPKLISALEIREDDVYERLKPDIGHLPELSFLWHSKCYEAFTSKENLRHFLKRRRAISPTPSEISTVSSAGSNTSSGTPRVSRSKSTPTDWSKCLFCKQLTHKKVKSMVAASTFQVCETIYHAAECRGDEELLRVLRGVNNDLVAAEGKYHKACFSTYVSKSNLKRQVAIESKQESTFDIAMRELVADISPDIVAGKAFNMTTLLKKYKDCLKDHGESADSYTNQRLKNRLQNHFGDGIVFHQTFGPSRSELVYSSSVCLQDVINAAHQRSTLDAQSVNPKQGVPSIL